uniref:recombinase family protein n=1 Tax=Brucella pseudintermedia TaxID=370111 RepID=UPI001F2ED85F|nr:recombinase family protein [Brucella pseudintermedia]
MAALRAAGCEEIVREVASGARARPRLKRLIDKLEGGDTLIVTRIDRLARSALDLHVVLDQIGKRGAGFRSLGDAWADTTNPHGRLLVTILAGLAEYERELIRSRANEGLERAKARGVKLGPRYKLTDFQQQEALARLERGELPSDVARSYGVSRWTITRLRDSRG